MDMPPQTASTRSISVSNRRGQPGCCSVNASSGLVVETIATYYDGEAVLKVATGNGHPEADQDYS